MPLSETCLDSDAVYDGDLLHVRRDRVRLPDGGLSVREWIDHPGAAAVVPLHADGRVTLLRQFRYATRETYLEVPAGKLDADDASPEAAARRELAEEAGLAAARWTPLGETHPGIGYSSERIHLFLAESLEAAESGADDDEFVEPVTLPFVEAVRRARAGELPDAKTAVALLLAAAVVEAR